MSSSATSTPSGPQAKAKLPRQIPYIIGNEACERFSFYGMRNILTVFLVGYLLVDEGDVATREGTAKDIFHLFVMGVYFFPLLGGWLADKWLGKYRTILYLSLVYCVGHGLLAVFEGHKGGFYTGLFLIALGSGGIKPCVSSFLGDQFDRSNSHLAKVVYDAFYWIINFGSFFASLLIPLTLTYFGPSVAFGIPGLLMFIATAIFWAGRKHYVNVPPSPKDPHGFVEIAKTALFRGGLAAGGRGATLAVAGAVLGVGSLAATPWIGLVSSVCLGIVVFLVLFGWGLHSRLDAAEGAHPAEDVEGVRIVLRVLVVFALVTPFWSLFDQKASTWILQAQAMEMPGWSWFQSASQMQALNPLLVMTLIPFNNLVLYPALRRVGIEVTPMRRMTAGMVFASLSWVMAGAIQLAIDGGTQTSIFWQVGPYALLTFGEVLVSATGLEFAYSQAPAKMKGVLMSFWSLSTTIGNLWVLLVNAAVKGEGAAAWIAGTGLSNMAFQMFFFAAFALAAGVAFGLYARSYRMVDNYRAAS